MIGGRFAARMAALGLALTCSATSVFADRGVLVYAERAWTHAAKSWGSPGSEPSGDCAQNFLSGRAPRVVLPQLSAKTRELCSPGYAVLHSGVTRTPLWSAEHLTPERVKAALG